MDFFFFNDTATTEIYTLSLHDALPICARPSTSTSTRTSPTPTRCEGCSRRSTAVLRRCSRACRATRLAAGPGSSRRSEEHTSELQSRQYLVCRLLLEKNKQLLLTTQAL